MMIRRCVATLMFAAVLNACSRDDSTAPLPAQDAGWERVGFGLAFISRDSASGVIGLSAYGGGLSTIDAATGTTRWQLQLPARTGEYFVASWVSPRDIFVFNPFPGASGSAALVDGASGTVRRTGTGLTQPFVILDTWSLARAANDALQGMTRLADSVLWRRTFPPITCGRNPQCRFFDPIGIIRNALYLLYSVRTDATGGTVDSLLRVEADGQITARALPFVTEPLTPGGQPRVSSAESLYWKASETSVYGVNLADASVRWRALTSSLVAPRAGVEVDFLHAAEDSSERTLRVAFYLMDTVRNSPSIEGVVLRMSDGSVVRRITLAATKRAQLVYVGPCGADGVAFVNSEGTIDYARWSSAQVSHWRSSKLSDAMPPYLQQQTVPFFHSAGASTLLVELGLTNTLLGLNCAQ